jgi:hypothetical protein
MEFVRARHTVSGKIVDTPRHIVEHDILGAFLEEVGPEAKPYLPEMHRVSLPENPTPEQVAVAVAAGIITDEEADKINKSSVPTEPVKAQKDADKNSKDKS